MLDYGIIYKQMKLIKNRCDKMKNSGIYLLKCISIGVFISCILFVGVMVYADTDNDEVSSNITDVSNIDDTSSEDSSQDSTENSVDISSDNNSEYESSDNSYYEQINSDNSASDINSEENSSTVSYNYEGHTNSKVVSDINSEYSSSTQSFYEEVSENIQENSQQESNQSSHTLIDGNSEIYTSEMTADDWHFDINSGNVSQLTDFSDIKDSEKLPEKVQEDDSQWILYLGLILIILGLGSIVFIITRYVIFRKNVELKLKNQKLQNVKKMPKNNNSNKKNNNKK